jgi:hypothetical protein
MATTADAVTRRFQLHRQPTHIDLSRDLRP